VLEDLFRLHAHEPCLVFAGSNPWPASFAAVSRSLLVEPLAGRRSGWTCCAAWKSASIRPWWPTGVLDEGVDLPEVKVAIVIAARASSRQAKQRLGRICGNGEARAVLYEIVTPYENEEPAVADAEKSDAYQGTRHRRV